MIFLIENLLFCLSFGNLTLNNERIKQCDCNKSTFRVHLEQEIKLSHEECMAFFLCRAFHKVSQHHQPWLRSMEKNAA